MEAGRRTPSHLAMTQFPSRSRVQKRHPVIRPLDHNDRRIRVERQPRHCLRCRHDRDLLRNCLCRLDGDSAAADQRTEHEIATAPDLSNVRNVSMPNQLGMIECSFAPGSEQVDSHILVQPRHDRAAQPGEGMSIRPPPKVRDHARLDPARRRQPARLGRKRRRVEQRRNGQRIQR